MRARLSLVGDVKDIALCLEGAAKAADEKTLYQALERGGEIVQKSVQEQVNRKAKSHPRGQLAESISLRRSRGAVAVTVGWEQTPMRGRNGKQAKPSGYTDVNGRYRKVTTVADYGRILEFSESRQLRHMEEGEEAAHEETEREIVQTIEKAIGRAIK